MMSVRIGKQTVQLADYEKCSPQTEVKFRGQTLVFSTPSFFTADRAMSLFEADTVLSEPETIRWINSMKEGELLIDIGANVGLHTVFAAAKKVQVIAIEPESSNYLRLNQNLKNNGLDKKVAAFCVAISDKTGPDKLNIRNLGVGRSCHNVGLVIPDGTLVDPSLDFY